MIGYAVLNGLYIKALQYRDFWLARRLVRSSVLALSATAYRLRTFARRRADSTTIFQEFIRVSWQSMVAAILAALLLRWVGDILSTRFAWPMLPSGSGDGYADFLRDIASICGVFLALYYTAIATVGASIYNVVPSDIRNLLARDIAGNVYLRFLSILMYLCVFLVAMHIYGARDSWLALGAVCGLTGFAIFTFVELGRRAFNLFDPTELGQTVVRDMLRTTSEVTLSGYRWWDVAFQDAARQRMDRHLRLFAMLAEYAESKPHLRSSSYPELAEKAVQFLCIYQEMKRRIPVDSAWYEPRPVYQDWYKANYNEVKVATQTGTILRHVEEKDLHWVEGRLMPILKSYTAHSVEEGTSESIGTMAGVITQYVVMLFRDGDLKRGRLTIGELSETVIRAVRNIPAGKTSHVTTSVRINGIVEFIASLPTTGLITYREALPSYAHSKTCIQIQYIDWSERGSVYSAGLTTYLLEQAEWLAPKLAFERAVYGRHVTPQWYINDLVLVAESRQLTFNAGILVDDLLGLYATWRKQARSIPLPWAEMIILSREWEYIHKLKAMLHLVKEHCEATTSARRATDLNWKDPDHSQMDSHATKHWRQIQAEMAAAAKQYAGVERSKVYPDCVGQFIHATADGVLDAMIANDIEMLKTLYPAYHEACLVRFAASMPKAATDWQSFRQEMTVPTAILLDLLDLSGYGILFAEYHANPALWDTVTGCWHGYFDGGEGTGHYRRIMAILQVFNDKTQLVPRNVLRINWEIAVSKFLSKLPRKWESLPEPALSSVEIIEHPSPMVRVFARDARSLSLDGIALFTDYYLLTLPSADALDERQRRTSVRDMAEAEAEAPGRRRRQRRSEKRP